MGKDEESIIELVHKAIKQDVDYIELRLDVIENITSKKATDIINKIREITNTPIILTNRTKIEGGFFKGSEEERINILKENAPLVEITDIELSTNETLRQSVIDTANKTIISYHNFEITPSQNYLQDIITKAYKIGDIPKIAVKPLTLEDTFILVKLMMENKNMIGISMDKIGSYTRVLGPIIGAPVTYAAIDVESAPGQLDVKTTANIIKQLKN
ncbi:type I 3-dehydroquinate dehydratase [Methanosphaera sp. WGK6]|uniref:type I 3-dehydroquinate dehydratase n=1 Tax=Methanosphaera sp. WGK6 TaxID=1561964 RepID=UPI002110A1FD|nr:type I 3-dehydroquinate dehydratase [Methanosphaera sp. WGK6]